MDYKENNTLNKADLPHLAATYTSLGVLKVCGYKFNESFNSILEDLIYYQNEDGSIRCQKWDTEKDTRFIYCACSIQNLLDTKKSYINSVTTLTYLKGLFNYEGGFGMNESSESNGKTKLN